MTKYEEIIMDRLYQSFVMGGDKYTFEFPKGKRAALEREEYIKAAEKLQSEDMVEIASVSEKRMRLRITEKGIEYGNLG